MLKISKPEPVTVEVLKNVAELLCRRYRVVELRQGVSDVISAANLLGDLHGPEEISKGERKEGAVG